MINLISSLYSPNTKQKTPSTIEWIAPLCLTKKVLTAIKMASIHIGLLVLFCRIALNTTIINNTVRSTRRLSGRELVKYQYDNIWNVKQLANRAIRKLVFFLRNKNIANTHNIKKVRESRRLVTNTWWTFSESILRRLRIFAENNK